MAGRTKVSSSNVRQYSRSMKNLESLKCMKSDVLKKRRGSLESSWKIRDNIWKDEQIILWAKQGLKYPQNEDISVIKSNDGWVVNHAGYKGNEDYFSDNLLVTNSKREALKFAKEYMETH